jgi:hypothetical protein
MVERNRNGRGIAGCLVSLAIAAVALIAIAVGVASVPLIARLEPSADAHRAADAAKPLAAGKSTPVSVITPRRFRPAVAYGSAS